VVGLEDFPGDGGGVGAYFFSPAQDPFWGPGLMVLMGWREMFLSGGVSALAEAANMAGHPAVFKKYLDGGLSVTDIDLFPDQRVGNAVVMAVDFDVDIDIDPSLAPVGIFVRRPA
jgi:hypothetical protein